ncbi:MAG: DUF692 domain-containing protein [Planctomycetes bacterium]|nr:DUF692 domain-containing protein [Planctomycetota bacterium]
MPNIFGLPVLGFGLGLRSDHYQHILDTRPEVGFFEVISENFMESQGWGRQVVDELARGYPFVLHGVSLGIASTDPLDFEYLGKIKKLRDDIGAKWVSDHLCWTGVHGINTHQLLPNPYTEEALKVCVEKVKAVQDFYEAPMLLENPSSYLEFTSSTMHEADFLRHLCEEANCGILLDINNVYVSAFNHDLDAFDYIDRIPHERVVQYHLAGHTKKGDHILDTHSDHVIDEVWELFKASYPRTGGASVMVEWDDEIPDFEVLHAEVLKAQALVEEGAEVARA